jgi:hypothetical protein
MFFGTPHRGSAYSDMGLTASKIVSAAGFDVNDNNVRDLKSNSLNLEKLRESFSALLQDSQITITTFQEGEGFTRSGLLNGKACLKPPWCVRRVTLSMSLQIVDVESSGIDHPSERKFTIHANHMDMCRFHSPEDNGYVKVYNEILRHVEHHNSIEFLKRKSRSLSLRIRGE